MKPTKRVVIFANGRLLASYIRRVAGGDYIIGVDRAAYWLICHDVRVDAAIGDFDSTGARELAKIRAKCQNVIKYEPDKNFTDTDLALEYADKLNPAEIHVYGALGNRFDHTLSAIARIELLTSHNNIVFYDDFNEIKIISGVQTVRKDTALPYLSILPVSDRIKVTLRGFKYNIIKKLIQRGQTIGISNEITANQAVIIIHSGKAMIVRSQDK